jgi:ribonuclease D
LVSLARTPAVVSTQADLAAVVRAASAASIVALDVEGNGLFAYRARLCTAQLAWSEGGETAIAIVDTLATDPKPLSDLLGARGPTKVLHDFTFDLKLLADAGIPLANLRDTSVLARFLGRKSTGLASLLASELGIVVAKELQQHDWSRRPLKPEELEYLAGDVRDLVALFDKLSADARALDIEEEVEVECAFKYETALALPREKRPAYLRIKGADALDAPSLAVLRRLVEERERIAEKWDEPPFKVAGNELLLALAQSKPMSVAELARAKRGVSSRLFQVAPRLVEAVAAGLADGAVPPADLERPARFDREVVAERRAREKRFSAWRRAEAKARGVDEQVVLPGHCLADLVNLETIDAEAIGRVKGIGARRVARYGDTFARLLRNEPGVVPTPAAETEP